MWRDGDVSVVDEIVADPLIRHSATGTEVTPRDAYKALLSGFQRSLFRPLTTIDDQVVSHDRVWTRATSRGVDRETGAPSIVSWLLVQRMTGGRIAEQWTLTAWGVDWAG